METVDFEKIIARLLNRADFFNRHHGGGDGLGFYGRGDEMLDREAAAALREVHNSALEEAAKVARDWKSPLKPGTEARALGHAEAARNIAAAISALKLPESGDSGHG